MASEDRETTETVYNLSPTDSTVTVLETTVHERQPLSLPPVSSDVDEHIPTRPGDALEHLESEASVHDPSSSTNTIPTPSEDVTPRRKYRKRAPHSDAGWDQNIVTTGVVLSFETKKEVQRRAYFAHGA